MGESNGIEIAPFPVRDKLPWAPTGNLFERTRSNFPHHVLESLEPKYGWEGMRYSLGFRDFEIKEWADKKLKVLEVGPGLGNSTKQLIDKGVNVSVIEPSLKHNNNDDIFLSRMKEALSSEGIRDKATSVNATDSALAFPNQQFDCAFAVGYNFQFFSSSELAALDQIGGVLLSLVPNKSSYFAFELGHNGTIPSSGTKKFKLTEFLDDYHIRHTLHPFVTDTGTEETAIRIFRHSSDGEDAVSILNALKPADAAKYIE